MTVTPLRVALVGMGRMGQALDALAGDRAVHVVSRIDETAAATGITRALLGDAQVAIDFTQPDAAVGNAVACLQAGCPVVIGTTGWDARRDDVMAAVQRYQCAALWSPNFSLGVQLFLAIAEAAAHRLRAFNAFDPHIVETHHTGKRDAPSGTAIAVADAMERGLARRVPISSVRVGAVPGTHEVILDAPFEQIRLEHTARDRRVFADGALTAARWLAGNRTPALYSMRDMLADVSPDPLFDTPS